MAQTSCLFLKMLPAELRNEIYELSFATQNKSETADTIDLLKELPYQEDDMEESVDLIYADPPSKSLVMTCRQINNEARLMYREAYQKYYTEQKFCIDNISEDDESTTILASFSSAVSNGTATVKLHDIDNIRYLSFSGTCDGSVQEPTATKVEYRRLEDKRIWRCDLFDPQRLLTRFYCFPGEDPSGSKVWYSFSADDDESVAKADVVIASSSEPHHVHALSLLKDFHTKDPDDGW